jgi:nitrous oxidase accessory protein NosD
MVVSMGARAEAASTLVVDLDGMASETACTDPDSAFMSINAAIVAASPGDTIIVCPGLYNEMVNIFRDNLKLRGAQAGIDARTRPTLPTDESVIMNTCAPVQITANNIVLDGFTVEGSAMTDPCLNTGIWTNPGFSGTQGGHTIINNIVQNNISGIELDSTCAASQTLVQFNLIRNNNNPGPGSGNGIQTNFGLCNATIDKNEFSGHTNASFLVVAPSSTLSVTNNTLVPLTPERIAFAVVTDATISGNLSMGSASSGTVRLFGGNANIHILNNTLLNGMRGIRIDDPFGAGINTGITADLNCIQGNTIAGMEVEPGGYPLSPQLNAENNWWGHPSGPNEIPRNPTGMGDKIIDLQQNVDFAPWLTLATTPPCPQPPPPNTPGKVTGGGQIPGEDPLFSPLGELISVPALVLVPSLTGSGSKASFGFVAKCCSPSGNLEYQDQDAGVRIKARHVDGLFIGSPAKSCSTTPGSKQASFTGMASVIRPSGTTTERYRVDVDDCGEPGSMDTFGIKTDTYSNGPSKLIGGNIQIHR